MKAIYAVRSQDSSYPRACRGLLEILCVCGVSGSTVNIDSDLGACYIGTVICVLFCIHIVFQNKMGLFNIYEKSKFHNSTYTVNPFWLTSTHLYRTLGRIYTQIVRSGW